MRENIIKITSMVLIVSAIICILIGSFATQNTEKSEYKIERLEKRVETLENYVLRRNNLRSPLEYEILSEIRKAEN